MCEAAAAAAAEVEDEESIRVMDPNKMFQKLSDVKSWNDGILNF